MALLYIYIYDRIDHKECLVTMNITNIDPISLNKVVLHFYFYKTLENPKAPMYMTKKEGFHLVTTLSAPVRCRFSFSLKPL